MIFTEAKGEGGCCEEDGCDAEAEQRCGGHLDDCLTSTLCRVLSFVKTRSALNFIECPVAVFMIPRGKFNSKTR